MDCQIHALAAGFGNRLEQIYVSGSKSKGPAMPWRPEFNPEHLYFVTTKAVDYAHLFQRDLVKRLLIDALDCMHLRQHLSLYAFVIMPNHIHLIAQFLAEKLLMDWVRDYKKHVADRLIRQYQVENHQQALEFLARKVSHPDKQKYKVWEDGYNAKDIFIDVQIMFWVGARPCACPTRGDRKGTPLLNSKCFSEYL